MLQQAVPMKFKMSFAPLAGPSLFVINPDQTFKFSMTKAILLNKLVTLSQKSF